VLTAAAVVCAVAVVGLALLMEHTYDNRADAVDSVGFWDTAGAVLTIDRQEQTTTLAGEDVGNGAVVEAMEAAPQAEQVRAAGQIEAATKMVNAFLNLDHEHIKANIEAVRSLATGPFLRQYTKASGDLVDLIKLAKATQTGEVEWAGLVAGDDDSATVIVATNGTISNKETDFEPVARPYRLQLEVDLVDGRWLTSDLQYVR
jgi:Mce-associated membrane protein